jgi:hypothetical protein
VARNAGEPLVAISFLRIVIEQFARRQAGLTNAMTTGDQIMDDYAGTLSLQYREVMPSLKVWYSKLSGAIHAACADEELLQEAMGEIERYFKGPRCFQHPRRSEGGQRQVAAVPGRAAFPYPVSLPTTPLPFKKRAFNVTDWTERYVKRPLRSLEPGAGNSADLRDFIQTLRNPLLSTAHQS